MYSKYAAAGQALVTYLLMALVITHGVPPNTTTMVCVAMTITQTVSFNIPTNMATVTEHGVCGYMLMTGSQPRQHTQSVA